MLVPFDLAQVRLWAPLKYASLGMTIYLFDRNLWDRTLTNGTFRSKEMGLARRPILLPV
jgi:hypothetical protein